MSPLSGWENFYVIVGSAAGALIGLQFVVITLIADMPITPGTAMAGEAFSTPTIVYFGTVLLLSAIVCAPWHSLATVAVVWGILGIAGVVYVFIITRRMRRQTAYRPEFEDWLFHSALPLAGFATLAASGHATRTNELGALFGVAGVSLVLLFVGIHNAWDAVTWHVFVRKPKQTQSSDHPR